MKQTSNVKMYVLLHALMFLFSLSPVCSKLAGRQPFQMCIRDRLS